MGEMVIMNDVEWPMGSYYVIYYEKLRKIMQWTEKEVLSVPLELDVDSAYIFVDSAYISAEVIRSIENNEVNINVIYILK